MDIKWTSKTMWVNTIALLAGIAGFFGYEITADLQAELVLVIMSVIGIALRLVTKEPIIKPAEPK